MTVGSKAPYAKPRNEAGMKQRLKASGDFPKSGPTSAAWLHKKLAAIHRRNEGNIARDWRRAQVGLLTARLDEEKQISQLTTTRRAGPIGEAGRARAAQTCCGSSNMK